MRKYGGRLNKYYAVYKKYASEFIRRFDHCVDRSQLVNILNKKFTG
jgi:hypothetical protein